MFVRLLSVFEEIVAISGVALAEVNVNTWSVAAHIHALVAPVMPADSVKWSDLLVPFIGTDLR